MVTQVGLARGEATPNTNDLHVYKSCKLVYTLLHGHINGTNNLAQ